MSSSLREVSNAKNSGEPRTDSSRASAQEDAATIVSRQAKSRRKDLQDRDVGKIVLSLQRALAKNSSILTFLASSKVSWLRIAEVNALVTAASGVADDARDLQKALVAHVQSHVQSSAH